MVCFHIYSSIEEIDFSCDIFGSYYKKSQTEIILYVGESFTDSVLIGTNSKYESLLGAMLR